MGLRSRSRRPPRREGEEGLSALLAQPHPRGDGAGLRRHTRPHRAGPGGRNPTPTRARSRRWRGLAPHVAAVAVVTGAPGPAWAVRLRRLRRGRRPGSPGRPRPLRRRALGRAHCRGAQRRRSTPASPRSARSCPLPSTATAPGKAPGSRTRAAVRSPSTPGAPRTWTPRFEALRAPLAQLAADHDLMVEPGRYVRERAARRGQGRRPRRTRASGRRLRPLRR